MTTKSSTKAKNQIDCLLARITEIGVDPLLDETRRVQALQEELASSISSLTATDQLIIVPEIAKHMHKPQKWAENFVRACKKDAKTKKAQKQNGQTAKRRNTLPQIQVNDRQHRDVVKETLDLIKACNRRTPAHPIIFVRGGALTRIVEDENENYTLQVLGKDALIGILAELADWARVSSTNDGTEKVTPVPPPEIVAETLLAQGKWPDLPAVESIVNAPTFTSNGSLHNEAGYNPETRLFYAGYIEIGDTTPTAQNVEAAKKMLLSELLGEFPFQDDASQAHALALLLLPFVRPMIDEPTPLHLITAPKEGSGKGLLASVCAIPSTRLDIASIPAVRDDEEWRKRLTSALLNGATHVSIDNITGTLDSPALASYLTQEYVEDRILGSSKNVRLKINNVWCANGNNVFLSTELARRSVMIRLDANMEKPWERDGFKHEGLRNWAKANRGPLIAAAVTLVRAWVEAGQPLWRGKSKGSYARWSKVMGGILETIGVEGFLANEVELLATSVSEDEKLQTFVQKWLELYGTREVEAYKLFMLASYSEDAPDDPNWHRLLDELLGSGNIQSRQTKLGRTLAALVDKVYLNHKIQKGSKVDGKQRWRLAGPVGPPSAYSEERKKYFLTGDEEDRENYTQLEGEAPSPSPTGPTSPPSSASQATRLGRWRFVGDADGLVKELNYAMFSDDPNTMRSVNALEDYLDSKHANYQQARKAAESLKVSSKYGIDWQALKGS